MSSRIANVSSGEFSDSLFGVGLIYPHGSTTVSTHIFLLISYIFFLGSLFLFSVSPSCFIIKSAKTTKINIIIVKKLKKPLLELCVER